jgi:hypothetical protein
MSAIYGARLGWNGFNTKTLTPYAGGDYGSYDARLSRYAMARAYQYNRVYDQLDASAAYLKSAQRLYKWIRSIENPVPRSISLYASYTYSGSLDTETLKKGALPLVYDNDAFEPALQQIYKWSNLNQQLGKYVSDAALLGDSGWWVVDDPLRQRIRIDRVDMDTLAHVERDDVGNVKVAVFESEYEDPLEDSALGTFKPGGFTLMPNKTHVKRMVVTKKKFQTFRDGELYPFMQDANEQWVSEGENIYGFVPLVLGYFAEGENGWGQNSFFGVARRQIDELNDQASIINDSIRNVVIPLLQAKGVAKASEITVTREDKDSMAIVYLSNPEGSLEAVSIPLDIAAATANRNDLRAELVRNMPILKLENLQGLGNLSGVAIENLLGDATSAVKQLRKNLDAPTARVLQMAVTMGAIQGYEGFEGFNADSFDRGDMELSIGERAVIDDTVDRQQRLTAIQGLEGKSRAVQRALLTEIGWSKSAIDDFFAEMDAEAEQKQAKALEIAGRMGNTPSNANGVGAGAQDDAAAEDEQRESEAANVG